MTALRVGVAGVGALGRHHARILSQMDGVELVAVADVRRETAEHIAQQHGGIATDDFREFLSLVDAAVIAVPTFAHLSVAREFLQREIPVLVEKPLASNLAESAELKELAEQTGTLLQVGHVERFNPVTQTAWPLITAPKYIRCERLSPFAFRSMDIGVVHDVMIHDIDLVLDLARSPVTRVEAFGLSILGKQEDSVQARLTFANGCIADLTANRVNPGFQRSMQIRELHRTIHVDFHAREVVCYEPTERLLHGPSPIDLAMKPGADVAALKEQMFESFLREVRPTIPEFDALTAELTEFVACVRTGAKPRVSAAEGHAAMEVANAILQGVAAHQWDGRESGAIGPMAGCTPVMPLRKAA